MYVRTNHESERGCIYEYTVICTCIYIYIYIFVVCMYMCVGIVQCIYIYIFIQFDLINNVGAFMNISLRARIYMQYVCIYVLALSDIYI